MKTGQIEQDWVSSATVNWLLRVASASGCSVPLVRWRAGAPQQSGKAWPPDGRLTVSDFSPTLSTCLKELGSRTRGPNAQIAPFEYGDLFIACVINCPTLHAAISQSLRFIQAVQRTQARLETSLGSGMASFSVPSSPAKDTLAALAVDFLELAAYYKIYSLLIGEPLGGEIALVHPPVADLSGLKGVLNCPMRFNDRENCLTFKATMLERPLCLSYLELKSRLRNCATSLLPLPGDRISARLEMFIRRALEANAPIACEDQIARQYGRSGPTLRRQLVQEGATFRGLLNKCRMERAAELLSDSDLTVEQISHLLSFSTASGFSRAFKGWTGLAPAAYRCRRQDALPHRVSVNRTGHSEASAKSNPASGDVYE